MNIEHLKKLAFKWRRQAEELEEEARKSQEEGKPAIGKYIAIGYTNSAADLEKLIELHKQIADTLLKGEE